MPETIQIDPTVVNELKTKAKATWATGSYQDVASYIAPSANHLVRVADLCVGDKVLDVATGTGVTAITARRTGADVTALDITPELLRVAEKQAEIAGVTGITWREGDAEALPFADASFDVVISSYGHMFAPRPDVTMNEMLRVLKPGGRIAFLCHRKDNVAQGFFAAASKYLPKPAVAPPSPFQWGDREVIKSRLGNNVKDIKFEDGRTVFPMLSAGHFWHHFSTVYGPTMKAVEVLKNEPAKLDGFRKDFTAAVEPFWQEGAVVMDYVITRAIKK